MRGAESSEYASSFVRPPRARGPEGFLQGYLTKETPARRNALDLASPAFEAVLNRLPKTGPMVVMGLIEVADGRLFNTAVVVDRGTLMGRDRKAHLLGGEQILPVCTEDNMDITASAGSRGRPVCRSPTGH
jgi:predicted amidohydrolase